MVKDAAKVELTKAQKKALIEAASPTKLGIFGGGVVHAHPHVMRVLRNLSYITWPDPWSHPRVGYLTESGRVQAEKLIKKQR